MKVSVSKSKNQTIYYLSKSVWLNGKSTTKTIEKIGSEEEIKKICGDLSPLTWAKQYAAKRSAEEKASKNDIIIKYSSSSRIEKETCRTVNVGYLFLKDIYYDLGVDTICKEIAGKYKFEYDLNDILSMLVFTRVIYPGSFIPGQRNLPSICLRNSSKNHAAGSTRYTGLWRYLQRKMTSFSHSFIRTRNRWWLVRGGSSTTTAPTIILK